MLTPHIRTERECVGHQLLQAATLSHLITQNVTEWATPKGNDCIGPLAKGDLGEE